MEYCKEDCPFYCFPGAVIKQKEENQALHQLLREAEKCLAMKCKGHWGRLADGVLTRIREARGMIKEVGEL